MKKIQNSYKKSGVNISLANKLVKHISYLSKKKTSKKRIVVLTKKLLEDLVQFLILARRTLKIL